MIFTKAKLRYLIAGLMICTMLLCNLTAVVAAQPQGNQTQGNKTQAAKSQSQDNMTLQKSENITSAVVAQEVAAKQTTDRKIKAANDFLKQKGYNAKIGPNAALGKKETFRGKNERGQEVEVVQTTKVVDYVKKNSKDSAALAQIEVSSQGQTRTYTFILEAPGGDIRKATEQAVSESGTVQPANSWWSCTYNRIISQNCGSTCISALSSCWTGSWVSYLGCLAYRCGWCYTKASLCCACDCSWWCRWASGCCNS